MVPEPPVPAVPYDQRVTFPKCDNPDEELLDFLRGLGASPELLETAMNSGHLGGLAGDLVLGQGANMTIADVARAAGVEDEKVTSIWRELGLRPEADDPRFGPRDVQAVELLVSASELQVEGAELLRVIGASLARVADAAVALYVQNVEAPASGKRLGQLGLARDLARTMEFTLRIGDTVLGPVLAQHLRDAIARQRTTQEGVSDRVMARMAVGFVDMVGSTQAANQLSSRALLEKVASFEARAFDLASENGGWIVKHVGDEVMFVALSGDVGCELALAMTEEFTASGIQPRVGYRVRRGDHVSRGLLRSGREPCSQADRSGGPRRGARRLRRPRDHRGPRDLFRACWTPSAERLRRTSLCVLAVAAHGLSSRLGGGRGGGLGSGLGDRRDRGHADTASAAWRSASSSNSADTPRRGAMISSMRPYSSASLAVMK